MGTDASQAARWLAVLAAAGAGLGTQAADVSAADVADAHVWSARSGDLAASGDWADPSNWQVAGAAAATPPTADDAVWFQRSGVHTVRLDADAVVGNLFVGGSDASGSPELTLDLGGRTLTAANDVRCGWAWKYPKLNVTNGCLVAGNELRVGFDSNLTSGFAWFRASGPETSVTVGRFYWGIRADGGAAETFAVTGGAAFETAKTNGSFEARSGSVNGGVNVYTFAGAGTRARLRGGFLQTGGGSHVRVADGAAMEVSGFALNDAYGNVYRGFAVGRSCSNARVTVDDAAVTVRDHLAVVGDCDKARLGNNTLTITNNGVFTLDGVDLAVCRSANGVTDPQFMETSNRVEVVDGGRLVGPARTLTVGHTGQGINSRVVVRNGVLSLGALVLGDCYLGISTNNWLEIGGTNPLVVCSSTGSGLRVNQRGGLRFSIGPAGYGQTPVQIPNGRVAVETTGQYWVEETKGALPSLVVDDAGFAAARPGESVTLVACGTPCPDALSLLATNLTVHAAKDAWIGTAVVSADGRNLLYRAPNRPGLTILLR